MNARLKRSQMNYCYHIADIGSNLVVNTNHGSWLNLIIQLTVRLRLS